MQILFFCQNFQFCEAFCERKKNLNNKFFKAAVRFAPVLGIFSQKLSGFCEKKISSQKS
jgi:hypothetical protein